MTIEKHLRDSLVYSEEGLRWTEGRNRKEFSLAARKRKDGYKRIRISYGGREYEFLEHRVVWLITHNEWPKHHLDHINGDKSDNRLSNLREATPSQNGANSEISKNNSSGWKGVYRFGDNFRAQIHVNRETKYLGVFTNCREAALAYNYAAKEHFGAFAKFNEVFEDEHSSS